MRIRSSLVALAVIPASMAVAAVAAAQPTHDLPARFNNSLVQKFSVAGNSGLTAASGTPAGSWGQLSWCNPYGYGTEIVGFNYLAQAFHQGLHDGVIIQENTDHGTVITRYDQAISRPNTMLLGPWPGRYDMAPSQCIAVKAIVRNKLSTKAAWTFDLQHVRIRDTIGPAVSGLAPHPGWNTGARVAFTVAHSDNGFGRGALLSYINNVHVTNHGDPGNGLINASVPIDHLSDGSHTLTVSRTGSGWPVASQDARFLVDRTPPRTPPLNVSASGWTNKESVEVTSFATSDGSGSGWSRNQFELNGVWRDSPNVLRIGTEGIHAVRVRAVDHAGWISAPSEVRHVHIDRTQPTIPTLEVSTNGIVASVRVVAVDPGSGLGSCPASIKLTSVDGAYHASVFNGPSRVIGTGIEMPLAMTGRPAGTYDVMVTVCDEAKNQTTRTSRFTWGPPQRPVAPTPPLAQSPSPSPVAVPKGNASEPPRVQIPASITRATTRISPRLRWTSRVRVRGPRGKRVVVRGRLVRGKVPVRAGTGVVVRDARGRVVIRTFTGSRGAVSFRWTIRRSERLVVHLVGARKKVVAVHVTARKRP